MNDNSNLREHFAALRRAEAASAPSFERVMAISRRRSNHAAWRLAITACILVVAVGGMILRLSHPPGASTIRAPALADWRAPTDFLLDTPGRELLHTIPDLGRHTSTGLDALPPIGMTMPAPQPGLEHS